MTLAVAIFLCVRLPLLTAACHISSSLFHSAHARPLWRGGKGCVTPAHGEDLGVQLPTAE